MMKNLILAAFMLAASIGIAHAACKSEIEKTKNDWRALKLEPGSKPSTISKGIPGHEHVQMAVDSMRFHLHQAQELCDEGKDHESLLHVNVIRAFLELPEFQHPASHHYLFKEEKK
jgi:hypothetical protein